MKKRILIFGLLAAMCLAGLSGCKTQKDGDDVLEPDLSANPTVITDLSAGDAQTHVVVLPQEFTEGEQVENLYYKRVAKMDGTPCYEVRTEDGTFDLPLSQTVVYTDPNRSDCYYETVTLEYKQNGEPTTALQYQLYVSAYAPDGEVTDQEAAEPVSTPDDVDVDETVDGASEAEAEDVSELGSEVAP